MITPRQYLRFYMPSTAKQADGTPTPKEEQKWIEYDTSPSRAADSFDINDTDNTSVRLCKFIASRIRAWNYTDENGKIAEINYQTVGEIPEEDLVYISTRPLAKAGVSGELTDEEKKS